jgi:hypothetical protein
MLYGLTVGSNRQSSQTGSCHPIGIDTSKVLDLTNSFDETTIYSPTTKPFKWEKESWGTSDGYWYASG